MNEPAHNVLISIRGLKKRFGQRMVLDGVDMDVTAGETVAIIGPSGGGKSTLLRSINGLNRFDEGTVRVGPHTLGGDSEPTDGNDRRTVARQIRHLAGMIFQDFQLFPHLTVLDNITLAPCKVTGAARHAAETHAHELLGHVGLGDRGGAWPDQLSGGQKQRVAIARALAMRPKALLCDEITSALDPELKHDVLGVLEDLKRGGMTIVMVTHEIGFVRRAADRVVVLAEGRIIEAGPPEQVLDQPQVPRTQTFLRNAMS